MKTSELNNPTIADLSIERLLQSIVEIHDTQRAYEPTLLPWQEMEPEVITELLLVGSRELTADQIQRLAIKVSILAKLTTSTDSPDFYELFYDVQVIPKLVEVLNNIDTHLDDAEDVPAISSMELAWFLDEIVRTMKVPPNELNLFNKEFRKVCAYVLHQEGCPIPPMPFSRFVSQEDIHRYWYEGETPHITSEHDEIIVNKQKAIDTYVTLMRSKLC
jgi:hypothetical protein